jgi:hypothetical protein
MMGKTCQETRVFPRGKGVAIIGPLAVLVSPSEISFLIYSYSTPNTEDAVVVPLAKWQNGYDPGQIR